MNNVRLKICGVKTAEAIEAAAQNDAAFLGFNFFKPSPRYVTPEMAGQLSAQVPNHIKKVALIVDEDDMQIENILRYFPADMLQLHGHETTQRTSAIKEKFKLPIIKAISVESADDLTLAEEYAAADYYLFDAKPPKDSVLPGGNATAFDWNILQDFKSAKPWFLAGGITVNNLQDAVQKSRARLVDIASGAERIRGEKDPALICKLLDIAKRL
jgi:phosphoribosylanthranilate isomerase